jgi:hypothetical protein
MLKKYFICFLFIFSLNLCAIVAQESAKPKVPRQINGGTVNSKAIELPKPVYPAEAKTANISGEVKVEVVIDQEGNVRTANAISGPLELRTVSENAALNAKFSPTKLSGQPIEVKGIIVYNFIPVPLPPEWFHAGVTIAMMQREGFRNEQAETLFKQLFSLLPGDYLEEKAKLVSLPKEAEERSKALTDVTNSLSKKLKANDAWGFELGRSLGEVMYQAKNFRDNPNYQVDEDLLRTNLLKLRDLRTSAPISMSPEFLEKMRILGEDANIINITDKQFLNSLIEHIDQFMQFVVKTMKQTK